MVSNFSVFNHRKMWWWSPLTGSLQLGRAAISEDFIAMASGHPKLGDHTYFHPLRKSGILQIFLYQSYRRASHTGDALRVGGVRGCQAEEFALAAQVATCDMPSGPYLWYASATLRKQQITTYIISCRKGGKISHPKCQKMPNVTSETVRKL